MNVTGPVKAVSFQDLDRNKNELAIPARCSHYGRIMAALNVIPDVLVLGGTFYMIIIL